MCTIGIKKETQKDRFTYITDNWNSKDIVTMYSHLFWRDNNRWLHFLNVTLVFIISEYYWQPYMHNVAKDHAEHHFCDPMSTSREHGAGAHDIWTTGIDKLHKHNQIGNGV